MEQAYWLESFTRRRFFPELETMPPDVVQQVTKQMQDLYLSTAQVMRRLHGERWHALCFYPRLEKDAPLVCPACQVQYDLEQLLLVKVYGHIGGVVIDFFHEPQHRDQLEAAVLLSAWAAFHWHKHGALLRDAAQLCDYALHRVSRLHAESSEHKLVGGQEHRGGEQAEAGGTTQEDLHQLAGLFTATYAALVGELDTWRRAHPGVTISAFPVE